MCAQKSTIVEAEISHFARDAAHWWDLDGPFKPLHRLNPVRMAYIRAQICDHFKFDLSPIKPLENIEILDIGCGGGLASESITRMGAKVTGMDADATAINVARTHAHNSNLDINYICGDIADHNDVYDVVCALEVIEHVKNPAEFFALCAERVKPGGLLILSTLNKTAKSYALGIIAAEYLLRWVPKGTHDWHKFLKPSQISTFGRNNQLSTHNVKGLIYNPLKNEFSLSDTDLDVNYLITLRKAP